MFPGYEIVQEIGRDTSWTLYRGLRARDRAAVIIKIPRADAGHGVDAELLERECSLLRELSSSSREGAGTELVGIPRVFDWLTDHRDCALVLEDRGLNPLPEPPVARRLELDRVLSIGIRLAMLLAELHRRGIVHNGIAPRNILVHPKTHDVCVCDLELASREGSATSALLLPRFFRTRLPYLSPEQTGRMNRAADYRTDFYSLGVTLYLLLTGELPFHSDDALEVIHWHIAKTPIAPIERDATIPEPLSAVIMKLLAKTAEERYQSALGLKADLERCAAGAGAFTLGSRDVADRFLIPQKLYGRDREVAELRLAFDRVCQGSSAPGSMMLVSGYSGVGKTSLIQELYKPIVRRRGYFISGKFDQVVRSVPFGGLLQAFRALVQQLLTESEARLSLWRERLIAALGVGAGVIAEVIPETELVIGKQPAPIALGPTEALNRFQLVFQNFIGALARREHPLVVFLDDLQWADPATLALLPPLLGNPGSQFLFLMGAYRDNEVGSDHPLKRMLRALEQVGGETPQLTLGPLDFDALRLFIRDTLRGELADAEPLARLVLEKTEGNPFFVIQFLKTLHQERLLPFDYDRGRWVYRLEDVASAVATDNVVDLMTRKIQQLSPRTQRVLTLAACVGNPFDEPTLAVVSELSPAAVAAHLGEALAQGLILRAGSSYTFLHDRVQQAAYALIPDAQKKVVHLAVGRLLLGGGPSEQAEEKVFDIVEHLNRGSSLIADEDERRALIRLNMRAGQKAKSNTAFDAALGYFHAGANLLREEEWQADYDLVFALHFETAQCSNLCGRFDEAERMFDGLLERARSNLDKAKVYGLRIVQSENLSRYEQALAHAASGLALFGVSFPASDQGRRVALEAEIRSIEGLVGGRPIRSLVELAVMTDPAVRMVMSILMTMWSSAYISGQQMLTRLISATMVRLSLIHGNSEESAYGYATHAITVGPVREDYEAAYEFGSLAMNVNERFADKKRRAKICQQFQAHAVLWRRPLSECIHYAEEASKSGLETGDFTYAVYGAYTATWAAVAITQDLARFVHDYSVPLALFKKLKVASVGDAQRMLLNWARALMGKTKGPLSLSDDELDEAEYVEAYRDNPFFKICHGVSRLHLCYLFGDLQKAVEIGQAAGKIIHHLEGTIWPVLFEFWNAMALAARCAELSGSERDAYLRQIRKAETSLSRLAASCPENYRCQHLMLSAQLAGLEGKDAMVIDLGERAIRYAGEIEMVQHQALASELYARWWLSRGQRKVAGVFLAQARALYAQWGAAAKVAELEQRYSDLLREVVTGLATRPAALGTFAWAGLEAQAPEFDLFSVMKAAQAMAGEIELEKLLAKLMHIAIENACAERGCLALEHEGEANVHAAGSLDTVEVKLRGAPSVVESPSLPQSIVNYVRRTLENVVLVDARSDDRYGNDPYIARQKPRSVMCIPVVNQARLIGVLYLENNKLSGAFTPDRILVGLMLASQAAICLENARLYQEMRLEIDRRRKAEQDLRGAVTELESLKNRLHAENVYLQEEIRAEHNFEEMVGNSEALVQVLGKVEMVARTDSTVLVMGETGTGKELIARAVHNRSARADRPLVKVNCGAIATGLVESELFGHVKGAFTGAVEKRTGRFELAHGGTLFLDEVGELSLETQVKLLRVLQEKEFEPVGSGRTVRVDVRVIGATNRNLAEEVTAGRFRADLYYRLSVFPLIVPALRERTADIPRLVTYFLSRFARKFGRAIDSVSRETMGQLMAYEWPGNVRELENLIERAVVLCQGPVLTLGADFFPKSARPRPVSIPDPAQPRGTLEDVERTHILAVLQQVGWIIEGPNGAAKKLDLHPNTLRSRLKKLRIQRPAESR